MINLTIIQGLYYYINTLKECAEKYDMLQGLYTSLKNNTKIRNKNNLYIIYNNTNDDKNNLSIVSHDRYTTNFNQLIQGFDKCVYINNGGIHLKKGDNITTYRILNYKDTIKYLFSDLDKKESLYYYYKDKQLIIDNVNKNLNKWYTLENAQAVYSEYLRNDIWLKPNFSKCKNYIYFENYKPKEPKEPFKINFNNDIYNTNFYYCIMLTNDNKDCFILNDIISTNKNIIDNEFNIFKSNMIENGKKYNIDNSKLNYKILA